MQSKIHTDFLKKVRQIDIVGRKVVDELLGGEYKSVFKGRGMEFDEEREQALFFLVDLSASGSFGSAEKTKNETAAETVLF